MSNGAPCGQSPNLEALYCAAEARAALGVGTGWSVSGFDGALLPSGRELLAGAARELDRYAVRRRYLPAQLVPDRAWVILLDLFVLRLQGWSMTLEDRIASWGMSEGTAARQMAALIEAGLVVRQVDDKAPMPMSFALSEKGQAVVKTILALYE